MCVVLLKIVNGVLQYAMSSHVISLFSTVVNDGIWHHVQVQWTSHELIIDVDYGLTVVCSLYNIAYQCYILISKHIILNCITFGVILIL